MPTVKTILIRFYLDPDTQTQFCGDLQVLPERKAISFRNEAELFGCLHRLVGKDHPSSHLQLNTPQYDKNISDEPKEKT
jgi:hypothetical protein